MPVICAAPGAGMPSRVASSPSGLGLADAGRGAPGSVAGAFWVFLG